MANLLSNSASWLAGQFKAHASSPVTYARGAASVPLSATVGRTIFELADDRGMLSKWESRDFLITATDLILSGAAAKPAKGDRITDADGYVFEVLSPGGEPEWRWSDEFRNVMRVHTKLVDKP